MDARLLSGFRGSPLGGSRAIAAAVKRLERAADAPERLRAAQERRARRQARCAAAMRRAALCLSLMLLWGAGVDAQVPGLAMVPLGSCQLSASQLGSAVGLASCTRASFTGSAGSDATQLVVTSVTGIILPGDTVAGTGITAGTTVTGQVSGTKGGAGTYQLSATNTASSASLTSGGIPASATMALLQAETANIRWRDDGGAPTTSTGSILVSGLTPSLYTGTLSALQFIAATGSPLLDVSFYR